MRPKLGKAVNLALLSWSEKELQSLSYDHGQKGKGIHGADGNKEYARIRIAYKHKSETDEIQGFSFEKLKFKY
ncbi:MAG: hypothetical protein INR69_13125 [Mucilaginibacter polytrichastri]|nr:hypothetical protein [Mucilaginibacter polytrichastri]